MDEVGVRGLPEGDQVVPGGGLVVLHADPLFLVVGGEVVGAGDLAVNETLVVVEGGVDQVADDFFLGPAFGRGALFAFSFGEARENSRQRAYGKLKPLDGNRHFVHHFTPFCGSGFPA